MRLLSPKLAATSLTSTDNYADVTRPSCILWTRDDQGTEEQEEKEEKQNSEEAAASHSKN